MGGHLPVHCLIFNQSCGLAQPGHNLVGRLLPLGNRCRFWHATHDRIAPYVDIILHRGWFWAISAKKLGNVYYKTVGLVYRTESVLARGVISTGLIRQTAMLAKNFSEFITDEY